LLVADAEPKLWLAVGAGEGQGDGQAPGQVCL